MTLTGDETARLIQTLRAIQLSDQPPGNLRRMVAVLSFLEEHREEDNTKEESP